jgi:DNA (cytosine-5)-methyltransferase 1
MNVLDLFSGIGAFSLGLERAGMRTVAFCEIDPYCRRVLAKHWPAVPCYDDVRSLTAERLRADGIAADVICGGFPCQDISRANGVHGGRLGIEGERSGLWREYSRLIGELRPQVVIVENVTDLLRLGIGRVLGDMATIGYDAEWHCIPSAYIGTRHIRDRVWIVAYPGSDRLEGPIQIGERLAPFITYDWREAARASFPQDVEGWASEPAFLGKDDDASHWMDRIAACGNAVVPAIPEIIGRAIMNNPHPASQ